MMASQTVHETPDVEGVCARQCTRVVWKHRGILVSIGVHAVCGCTEVKKLSRIPGSQEGVKGVISFKGEVLPVLSLLEDIPTRSRHQVKGENFVVILSLGGIKFALEVNEVPCVVTGTARPDRPRGGLCSMQRRHLERLLRSRFADGRLGATCDRDAGTAERAGSPRGDDYAAPRAPGHRHKVKRETATVPGNGRCAFEEGVRWKRH